jgi:hypothetical protein
MIANGGRKSKRKRNKKRKDKKKKKKNKNKKVYSRQSPISYCLGWYSST